ncbi:hypothetical protein AB6N23_05400 [Cellulomonas sp. 179-A 9B4 NHS]|uniref:hypothetical protein n=1 Tax=Cellulomonas sp. 179-A 9B4 NHS TaxID=3142379 RepID=UPI00399F44F4
MRHAGLATVAVVGIALCAGCADTPAPGSGALETVTASPTDASTGPTATPVESPVPNVAETFFPGAPPDVGSEEIAVTPGDDPRQLLLVTWGSSTCPTLPDDVTWDAAAEVLRVTLTDATAYGDAACTADMAPTTSVVRLPDEAPDAAEVTVEVAGARLPVD